MDSESVPIDRNKVPVETQANTKPATPGYKMYGSTAQKLLRHHFELHAEDSVLNA